MGFGVNPATGRPGPAPRPGRDGDRKQARQRINIEVRRGDRPHPNTLACVDCGHIWQDGERRHEYDHYLGYAAEHQYDVEPVCTTCHARRDNAKARQTHCSKGHEFTVDNTRIKKNGTRECRSCRRIWDGNINRGRDAAFWREYRANRRLRDGCQN